MSDSMLIGEDVGDLLDYLDTNGFDDLNGADVGEVADLVADYLVSGEIGGRGKRRRKERRWKRHHKGMTHEDLALLAQIKSGNAASAIAQIRAAQSGLPQTVPGSGFLAPGQERIEYAPFNAATLGTAVGSTVQIVANIQRAIQPRRIILQAVDTVTGADVLFSCGVSSITVGVRPVFNSNGVAPADAFSSRAVGVALQTDAAQTGNQITASLQRLGLVTNISSITGMVIGVSAQ
jgi:hypothetical protein